MYYSKLLFQIASSKSMREDQAILLQVAWAFECIDFNEQFAIENHLAKKKSGGDAPTALALKETPLQRALRCGNDALVDFLLNTLRVAN